MEAYTIQYPDQVTHEPVAQARLERHCTAFGAPAYPRAQDEVGVPFADGCQDQGQVSRIITAIAIHIEKMSLFRTTTKEGVHLQEQRTIGDGLTVSV